jgi:tRNA-binding protein
MTIAYEDFDKVDLRSGTIVKAEPFLRAKKPAYKVWVDFGSDIGILQTSAQITINYQPENLIGRKVIGCVNLGEKNIAGFTSQFLLVGFSDHNGAICLATVDGEVSNGEKMH